MRSRADLIVGDGKLIDPVNICHIYVSPRQRAQKTFQLLFGNLTSFPSHETLDDAREWDYGAYEGLISSEIRQRQPNWEIFRDGCPDGESAEEMAQRMDRVIAKVRKIHEDYLDGRGRRDVMIVSHGHFCRSLIARWVESPLTLGMNINVETAGVALLSYNHRQMKEPAINGLNLYAF